jgi:hypothetical protein
MNIFEYDVACALCDSIDKFCPRGPLSSLIHVHVIVALRARGANPACNPAGSFYVTLSTISSSLMSELTIILRTMGLTSYNKSRMISELLLFIILAPIGYGTFAIAKIGALGWITV